MLIEANYYFLFYILVLVLPIVITVAFYTLTERKIIAAIQRRTGPNVVGFWGSLQPFADGLKAILKEQIKPLRAVFYLFLFAPILTFLISLLALNFICFEYTRSYFDEYLNFFFFLSISSFNVLGIILAGWTSNSKYTILGSLRAAAQVFSFEMCFITLLLPIFLLNSSFNLIDIVLYQNNIWNICIFFPTSIFFFIILLAETNRTPFDLPEAEAELVAGYNLEYSSINFALFFLGEYTNMLLNSAIFVIFFLGGWYTPNLSNTFYIIELMNLLYYILDFCIFNICHFHLITIIFFLYLWKCIFYDGPDVVNLVVIIRYNIYRFSLRFMYLYSLIIKRDVQHVQEANHSRLRSWSWSWLKGGMRNKFFLFSIYLFIMYFFPLFDPVLNFIIKTIFIACLFIVIRAILPRYRFDQLMDLCWKKILPMSCTFFLFFIFNLYLFDSFLYNLEIIYLKPKYLIINYLKML